MNGMTSKEMIPVTVLTGFLGAGKTTLLNYILSQRHGHKCAVVINEFGAIGIDNQLVVGVDEEILELNNGCLCCRVRGDLIKSLSDLFQRQKRFDYVLIETTGLVDPGPVVQTFGSSELAERLRLDGIVTVVDAQHIEKELSDAPEASAQIAYADVILLNKTDLVGPSGLEHIEERLRKINRLAHIHRTRQSEIELAKILNLKARDLSGSFAMPEQPSAEAHEEHDHHEPHDHDEHHHEPHHAHHDERVKSLFLVDERPLDLKKIETWLTAVIRAMGPSIYRSKGILYLKGQPKRVVFQGVQMIFDARPDRFWNPGEERVSQLVFIGRDLDEAALRTGFEGCLAS
jgi:G3E family GTPase